MKAIKLLMLLVGLPMIITVAIAQNANLNAPVSRQPTVGSEIQRGNEAAFDCSLHYLTDLRKFIVCMNDLIETNRQKSTLSEPFELGLYLQALSYASVHHHSLNSDGSFTIWRDRAIAILTKIKLSIRDYCKAIEAMQCDTAGIDQQSFGSFTAAAAARAPNKPASPAPAVAPSK